MRDGLFSNGLFIRKALTCVGAFIICHFLYLFSNQNDIDNNKKTRYGEKAVVITKTPFRISFFGGGTDYPAWYEHHGGGIVLSASIDKYCYLSCRYLPPFFEHKSRIVWSKIESVKHRDEIEHPAVRGILTFLNMHKGLEIHHNADLPARTGLGSSSSFVVGLLHALYALQGKMTSKQKLAFDAIHLEQNVLAENVGSQDQVAAAYGGLNRIAFPGKEQINVTPLPFSVDQKRNLQNHLMLFFTGVARSASEIAAEQIKNVPQKIGELQKMGAMVGEAIGFLETGHLEDFGRLLHESWQLKRGLSSKISTSMVDEVYAAARGAGALGGKLLGAGGGGFMLFFVRPEDQPKVKERLANFLHVPFAFEEMGSHIIHYSPESHVA